MTTLTASQLPGDFEELLNALCMAGKHQRPLALHDETLRSALQSKGLVCPSGAGVVGATVLEDMMKLQGAVQLIALLLQQPSVGPVVRPSFASLEPSVVAKRRIELTAAEQELIRHAQVLGVHVEGLQRELELALAPLAARFTEVEDTEQLALLAGQLPPSTLRRLLEQRAGTAGGPAHSSQ